MKPSNTHVGNTKERRIIASDAMMAALCVVIMFLRAVIDLGAYAAALLAGVAATLYGQSSWKARCS